MADKYEDKAKHNVKALRSFRVRGEVITKGEVIPKSRFAKKGDWQNLCNMAPAKAEETSDKVGKPAKGSEKSAAGGLPGAGGK